MPLFHSNSTGSLAQHPFPHVTDFPTGTMARSGMSRPPSGSLVAHGLTYPADMNVAYAGTFGDLDSNYPGEMFGAMADVDMGLAAFIRDGGLALGTGQAAVHSTTISPKDVFNPDSVPPSTSFTNLTTPGSTYLDTPDDSFETSPLYSAADSSKYWPPLFGDDEDATATTTGGSFAATSSVAPQMTRTTSTSSGNQILIHPGGEPVQAQQRKRSSTGASPATFGSTAAAKHSAVAGVGARKRDKPLPPILVDENDAVALKRAKNTAAARKSRAKKVEEHDKLLGEIADLKAEVEYWKSRALADDE